MTEGALTELLDEVKLSGAQLTVADDGSLKVHQASKLPAQLLTAIRTNKSSILAHLSTSLSQAKWGSTPLRGAGRTTGEELSAMQRAIWLRCKIEPHSNVYNILHVLDIHGEVDAQVLRASLEQMSLRHGSLRTRFVTLHGEPRQVVDPQPILAFVAEKMGETELADAVERESKHVFDLETGPLFYAKLFQLDAHRSVFLFNVHHIVFDGWSRGVFLRELSALYAAGGRNELKPLPYDYVDFSRWLVEARASDAPAAQAFWRKSLDGAPEQLNFPTDRQRPARMTGRGATFSFDIPAVVTTAVRTACRLHKCTLPQFLISAFQVWLSRYSGQRDVVVGVPFANRGLRELESLIGYFVNPLPIRQILDPDMTFADLIGRNRRHMTDAMAHQDYPFEAIVRDANPSRNLSFSPIFQHMFSFQMESDAPLKIAGAEVHLPVAVDPAAMFDFMLSITDNRIGLKCIIQFNTDLFEDDSPSRWADNFITVLEQACERTGVAVGQLSGINASELAYMARCLDSTKGQFVSKVPRIQHAFEAIAQKSPEAAAIRFGGQVVTYGQLDGRANAIAALLQRRAAIGPGGLVGICMSRTPDLVATVIAILKLGAAYVPLDPKNPRARLDQITEQAGLACVVGDATTRELIGAAAPICVADADPSAPPGNALTTDDDVLSHVIFTSGSTGQPKGVMVTHRNVLALMEWVQRTYDAQDLDAVLFSTSIGFDLSVFEMWAPLSNGGSIVLVENASRLIGAPVQRISLVNTVPSALRLLVSERALPPSVRVVSACGEPLYRVLVQEFFAAYPAVTLLNLYGPTEDTTFSTMARILRDTGEDPPIGVPLVHSYARILNSEGGAVPLGGIGELYLGGAGVARGYFNDTQQTSERFVRSRDYQGNEAVEFRTGDMVRLRGDGQLYFLGRADHQIKIRGLRVELGEIEHALRKTPGVLDVCVMARRRPAGDILVAHVVHESVKRTFDQECADRLEEAVRSTLPDYMVPQSFLFMTELPLNNSGKINRAALLEMELQSDAKAAVVETSDPLQRSIGAIWKSLLQLDAIDPHEDFFRLGGNSLLAVQMISRVNKEFATALPTYSAFEYKTVASLAAAVLKAGTAAQAEVALEHLSLPEGVDPTFAQLAMLKDPSRIRFNMCRALQIEGRIDESALRRCLQRLMERQDALRSHFSFVNGSARMQVRTDVADILRTLTLAGEDTVAAAPGLQAAIDREWRTPFNLQEGPPARALLIRMSPEKHVLVLSVHHTVSDIWSINIIKKELAALYRAELDGSAQGPSPLPISYADFAHWQRRLRDTEGFKRQFGYWSREFAGIVVEGAFPLSPETPADPKIVSKCLNFFPGKDWETQLLQYAARSGTTPYVIVMAGLQLALAGYSGIEQQAIWTPISRRTSLELEDIVGMFMNLIVVAERVRGELTLQEFLALIDTKVRGARANSDVSALTVVMMNPAVRPALPLIGLNHITSGLADLPWELAQATVSPIEIAGDDVAISTAMDVELITSSLETKFSVAYSTAVFSQTDVTYIVGRLIDAVSALVGAPDQRVQGLLQRWRA